MANRRTSQIDPAAELDARLTHPLTRTAAILGLSISTTRRLVKSGDLETIKVLDRQRVTSAGIRRFLRLSSEG